MDIIYTGYLLAKKDNMTLSKKTQKPLYWYNMLTSEGRSRRCMSNEPVAQELLSVLGMRMVLVDAGIDVTDGGLFILGDVDVSNQG